MAAPTCPDLAFAGCVTTAAALTLTLGLDALYASLTATVTDDGAAIPAASQPQVTKSGAPTDCIVFEPAASSPVAGKWVIIIAGAALVAPNGAAMLAPDTAAVAQLHIGIWMANSGATVSRADLTAAWSTATPFTGTGTFSGYTKFYAALTTIASMTAFLSPEHVVVQCETNTGTQYLAEAGFGIRGVSTAALDSESGLLGRVFTLSTCGASPLTATWQTANLSSGVAGLLGHATFSAGAHCYYRIPGATSSAMRACAWNNPNAVSNGLPVSAAAQYLAASGTVEPDSISMRDCVGSGGRDGSKVGRHRAFFFGPRKRSRYVLSTGGVAKWITAGAATSGTDTNDCVLLPM